MLTIEHRASDSDQWSKVASASDATKAMRAALHQVIYRHGEARIIDEKGGIVKNIMFTATLPPP